MVPRQTLVRLPARATPLLAAVGLLVSMTAGALPPGDRIVEQDGNREPRAQWNIPSAANRSSKLRYPKPFPAISPSPEEPVLPSPVAIPSATPGPSPSAVPVSRPSRVATIVFGDASVANTRAANAKFQLVKVRASESVTIALPLPAGAAVASLQVIPLDGGRIVQGVSTNNGAAAIAFQAGTQPGLYRLLVTGAGPAVTLQFWVPNPQKTGANPPVLNPAH